MNGTLSGRKAPGAVSGLPRSAPGETRITVRFLGGTVVPGLPRQASVDAAGPLTVEELIRRLEPVVGINDLRSKLEHHFAHLVDGTSIQHLEGWATLVRPGADVSVVAPMGGGGESS